LKPKTAKGKMVKIPLLRKDRKEKFASSIDNGDIFQQTMKHSTM